MKEYVKERYHITKIRIFYMGVELNRDDAILQRNRILFVKEPKNNLTSLEQALLKRKDAPIMKLHAMVY